MGLSESDYFGWFNSEITRYRNHEWQLCGYVGALLAGVGLWASDSARNHIFVRHPRLSVMIVVLFVASCILGEVHVHRRLNFFRAARTLLQEGKTPQEALGATYKMFSTRVDFLYFFAFQAFNVIAGIAAVVAILGALSRS